MAESIQGTVRGIDPSGNLITDISADRLAGAPSDERTRVVCDEHETVGIFRSAEGQPAMTLIALLGASGCLELAIVGDSAAIMLGVEPGAPVTVTW